MESQIQHKSIIVIIIIGVLLTIIPSLLVHGMMTSFEQFELDSNFQEQYSIFFLPVIIIGEVMIGFGVFIMFLRYQKMI